jgi:AraC-like DNA-binding protein
MSEHIFDSNRYSVVFAKQELIGEEWNDVVWDKNHHQIQYHRLYFPTSGAAKLHLYDKTIDLVPGRIYFIPAFSVIQSEIHGEMNKYYIHFSADSPIFALYRYLSDRYSVPADEMTEYLFKCIVDNYTKNTHEAYLKVQGAMNLLLSSFFSEVSAQRHSLLKFEGVLKYIDENYKRNIPLSELAALMNISTMYFSNYFKQVFHISPKQYILNKRLSESQRLLLESEMSVKEIAYAVGFENESYFSEFFSKKVGISALKFRNRDLPRT